MRHRGVVDDERPRPASRAPDPAIQLPEADRGRARRGRRRRPDRRTENRRRGRAARSGSRDSGVGHRQFLSRSLTTVVGSPAMPLDPSRTVAELKELRGAHRATRTAPSASPGPTRGRRARGLAARQGRRHRRDGGDRRGGQPVVHAARRLRARAPDRRPHRLGAERRLARRLPQRHGRRRGAAPDRRRGHAAAHRAARQLGGRGRRALRPLALRLVGRRRLDGRPGRAATADATPTASRCRTRCASTASTSTARSTRARSSRTRPRTSSSTSSRGPCSSRSTCRSASCSGPSGWSATRSPGRARQRTRDRRRWTSGATRSPVRPSSRSRSGRSPPRSATAPSAPRAASSASRASSPPSSRPPSSSSISGISMRDKLARMLGAREGGERAIRARGEHRRRVEPDLEHRADPVRRAARRARRRSDPRGVRDVASTAERPVARRCRGRARRRTDRHGVRAVAARPLAHEARGHEGGAPGARRCRRSIDWQRRRWRHSHERRQSVRRRARPAVCRDGRRGRLHLARRSADPHPHLHGPEEREGILDAAHLRSRRRELRARRLAGRHARASGLVPEPRREPRGRRAGEGRQVPRPRTHGRRRGARKALDGDERDLAALRRVPGEDRPPIPVIVLERI